MVSTVTMTMMSSSQMRYLLNATHTHNQELQVSDPMYIPRCKVKLHIYVQHLSTCIKFSAMQAMLCCSKH